MSQLSGFGHQSMAHHFQQMESGNLQHQHNIHQLMHQNQMSSHPHQGSPQPQRNNLHQQSSSPFPNQTGAGVPYVKIIEQPAGNKLRFRYTPYIKYLLSSIFIIHSEIYSFGISLFCLARFKIRMRGPKCRCFAWSKL